jgi:hypothetical protein
MVISSARIFTRRRAAVSIAGSNGAFGLGGGGYGGGSSHGGFLRAYGKRDRVGSASRNATLLRIEAAATRPSSWEIRCSILSTLQHPARVHAPVHRFSRSAMPRFIRHHPAGAYSQRGTPRHGEVTLRSVCQPTQTPVGIAVLARLLTRGPHGGACCATGRRQY